MTIEKEETIKFIKWLTEHTGIRFYIEIEDCTIDEEGDEFITYDYNETDISHIQYLIDCYNSEESK